MNPLDKAEIGSTGVMVSRLGVGGAPFGSMSVDVAEQRSIESIAKGLELGISYYDTAPLYGAGRSERYYANGLSGVERDSYVLSTKVGRVLNPWTLHPALTYSATCRRWMWYSTSAETVCCAPSRRV